MKISKDIIDKIESEYREWEAKQYSDNSDEQRKKLGQFYTPPVLSVKMLEKFEDLNGDILDPTVGAGGLIAAVVIAGADPRKCFGIELDPNIIKITRARLVKLGVPPWNIKQGDALVDASYDFDDKDNDKNFISISMRDLGMSSFEINLSVCRYRKAPVNKTFRLELLNDDIKLKKTAETLWALFEKLDQNEFIYVANDKLDTYLKIFNAVFKKYLGKDYKFSDRKICCR